MANHDGKGLSPLLRWPGGKQWLTEKLIALVPKEIGVYYEPFIGGAALFFALRPARAVLGDANRRLIETYETVRDNPRAVERALKKWPNTERTYYRLRSKEFTTRVEKAAQFIYLNKTCWNGLYRVNRRGKFNVPFSNNGRRVFDSDHLHHASAALRTAELVIGDFGLTLKRARERDFVYLDPPYITTHGNNNFRSYNERLFSWEDQKRLAVVANKLADQNCYVVLSNSAHQSIIELYKKFDQYEFTRHSVLAGKVSGRKKVREALFVSKNIKSRTKLLEGLQLRLHGITE
ncbi:MAG: Dam family site-specific DNA-(adenine-N6)-methyltransferase [Anaerolineales bacterium]